MYMYVYIGSRKDLESKADAHAVAVKVATNEPPCLAQKRKAQNEEQAMKEQQKEVEKKRKIAEVAAADEVGRLWMMRFNQKGCTRYGILTLPIAATYWHVHGVFVHVKDIHSLTCM